LKSSVSKKHGGARPGAGKPLYQPTQADRATVQNLAAVGVPHAEIARCIGTRGISEPTLRKHFRRELDVSLNEVKALAMSGLVKGLKNGEAWAVCFTLKTRAGWKETQGIQHSGPGGGPSGEILSTWSCPTRVNSFPEGGTMLRVTSFCTVAARCGLLVHPNTTRPASTATTPAAIQPVLPNRDCEGTDDAD